MTRQFCSWVYIQKKPKTLIWKDTCTPTFIAALLTIAKIWKQPKQPSIWMDKEDVVCVYICVYIHIHTHTHTHTHTGILLSHKKEWNDAICSTMDGWTKRLSYGVKSVRQRKTNTVYHLYVESKKYNKLVNITKKEADSQIQRTN